MKLTTFFAISAILAGIASSVSAAVVHKSQRQPIITDGQFFEFVFDGLPASDGTGGEFLFVANGDYGSSESESAVVTLDLAGGMLDLGGSAPDKIISNTVPGLSLKTFGTTRFDTNDFQHVWRFIMSGTLLDTLLADDKIEVDIQNDPDVGHVRAVNPDFVRVAFEYTEETAVIPIPTALPLFVTALVGLCLVARRRVNLA